MSCSCGIFLLVHLADDDGGVDRRQHRAHVVDELDRARTIEERVGVAHEVRGGDRKLDAHAVMARLLAGVADRVAGLDRALARDRAGAGENGFEKRGLAALEGTDQRDAARARPRAHRCCACVPCLLPSRLPPRTRSFSGGGPLCSHRFRRGGAGQGARLARTPRCRGATMPQRRVYYWARCSSSEPMPAAILSPSWPCTDNGCSATDRFDPPTRTLAPRPARDRHFRLCSGIGAGEHAGITVGSGKHVPDHCAAAGDADIEADLRHRARIRFRRTVIGLEIALHVALRADDQADARRKRAFQRSDLDAVLRSRPALRSSAKAAAATRRSPPAIVYEA